MSFDDYANHIYQKHRLAVALAILKSKPLNVKTNKYLEELKSKIDHKMDDDDITVCSDDFLMEADDEMNDSVTILKDFDPDFVNNDENLLDDDQNEVREKPPTIPEIITRNIPENISQITYYDGSQTQYNPNIVEPITQNDYNLSQKIDIEETVPKNVVREEFYDTVRNVDQNTVREQFTNNTVDNAEPCYDIMISQYNQNLHIEESVPKNAATKEINERKMTVRQNTVLGHKSTQNTYAERNDDEIFVSEKYLAKTPNESIDVTYYDSQKTIPYTVHGFTENYTHYSPSQADIIIPNKYLYNVNKNTIVSTVQDKDLCKGNHVVAANDTDFENKTQVISKGSSLNSKTVEKSINKEEFEYIQTMNMFSQSNDDNFDEIQNNIPLINSERHETMNDICNIINEDTENCTNQNSMHYSQNVDVYFDEIQIIKENITRNSFPDENNIEKAERNPKIAENMEINEEPFGYSQNIDYLSQNKEIKHSQNKFEKSNVTNDESNTENLTQNSEKVYQMAPISSGNDFSDKPIREEEEFQTREILSYKVLEEFNKVKSFLKRQNRRMSCDGYSTDSGYRSDSQRNSNRSALQLSGNWLNQSGCCLFNYIMQCPLVAGTRDITNEIAQVLSQLIDRLHEEEQYPSFLEDLLETINLLLRQVYEGEANEDGEFLKKDEIIQRILLLNKSIHIQRHCLEKITNILETFHSNVTETDSTYELSNIDQIENITYIFHILEMLLKKYLKNREIFSQNSTQKSQDDERVFKKSSISDIWRKKWNPSQKVFEGSREKKCVLKKCSEILNRIVVDCVSSYSLVAYSALKCFNSMQT